MASSFAQEWADAEPDLDGEMGESILFVPRAQPLVNGVPDVNARSIADPVRVAATIVGRFSQSPVAVHPQGRAKPSSAVHQLRGAEPRLCLSSLQSAALIAALGGKPAVNDWIERLDTSELFRIEDINPLDLGMIEYLLARLPFTP